MGVLNIILKVGHPKIISTQISEQNDSPALHSKWLLLLKIEISLDVNFCFITNQNELKF
jgi:hypothetical protein